MPAPHILPGRLSSGDSVQRYSTASEVDLVPEPRSVDRSKPLFDEPVADRTFALLDELEALLVIRRHALADPASVKAHTLFDW